MKTLSVTQPRKCWGHHEGVFDEVSGENPYPGAVALTVQVHPHDGAAQLAVQCVGYVVVPRKGARPAISHQPQVGHHIYSDFS